MGSMDTSSVPPGDDPAALVAGLENRAQRVRTPCGEGELVWRCWGSGPPVVLLHGAHGSWTHWIRNIDALASRHSVWAVDLPGYGESAALPEASHESIARVLSTGIRRVMGENAAPDMVGFSFGGVAAAWLSVFYPALVRRLILVDTGGLDTPKGAVDLRRVRGLQGREREAAHRHNLLNLMLHHADSVDPLALYLQEVNGMRGRLNPSRLVLPDKLLEALKRTSCQVDAIWGEWDLPHPDPGVQEEALARYRPDLDFRVIAGAGHWAMYECPDAFNRELIELLETPLRHEL